HTPSHSPIHPLSLHDALPIYVDTIKKAGLITRDWAQAPDGGMVSSSVVVFDVRPGNPKNIRDWNDLTQPGLSILTPDPAQSGGRSEEHTSELQSRFDLVCRLL